MVYGSILHAWRPFSLAPAAKWLSLVGWRCQIAFVALDWLDFLIYRGKSITLPLSHYANLASRAHLWRQWVSSSKWILLSWPKKISTLSLKYFLLIRQILFVSFDMRLPEVLTGAISLGCLSITGIYILQNEYALNFASRGGVRIWLNFTKFAHEICMRIEGTLELQGLAKQPLNTPSI